VVVPGDLASYGGTTTATSVVTTQSNHTEWADGKCAQTGFTTAFTPNTVVTYTLSDGTPGDVDYVNQAEGAVVGSSPNPYSYAAVTARSYHPGCVMVCFMDGSVRSVVNEIDLGTWRALSTRAGGEVTVGDY
jgi:hypothetical protein